MKQGQIENREAERRTVIRAVLGLLAGGGVVSGSFTFEEKTSGTGMGLYVKRRKSMYSVCAMDDDFPRSGNFYCSCSF